MMLLWFRNDIRVADNPALSFALENGVTDAIFFVSKKQWQLHNWSTIKIDFLLRHVNLLKEQLKALGVNLSLVDASDFSSQSNYLLENHLKTTLIVNTELELNENLRDQALMNEGVKFISFESDVIVPKGAILNNSEKMYKVFTPFKRAWLKWVQQNGCDVPNSITVKKDARDENLIDNKSCSYKWPLANQYEQEVLPRFFNENITSYKSARDFPALKGTSGISAYLAIGAISPRLLLKRLSLAFPEILMQTPEQAFTWLNELIWREFYRHLLFHYPNLIKGNNFNNKYDGLLWSENKRFELAWKQGRTGYPIVDAAMRQLNQTGWMHNRLRMIVASFLTKHLLINWRVGERYFANNLIDYDFAANNGGWQWSSGTGCDAQPYFRIFNPITQSKKFDPNGDFIRKYLPELAVVPNKHIHFPHDYIDQEQLNVYWPAIVEHKVAREQALSFYKQYL